jgi:cell division protein FtsB
MLFSFFKNNMSSESETIYDRISKLEDEVATLRSEIDFLKRALRNELARHEVKMAKKGTEVSSLID